MKLKKLLIQGFKSFKDRTTIHFNEGITGIVGPNGCGKSNIVDALFWVMGEQSAKHLRGNSMKDVIFAGSEKYAPAAFAEVTLVLDNRDSKSIHIGDKLVTPSEILLTRKLYRNGETEYRLNGEICRLKDIQEVFMDTGVGAKSYSIIAQGEVNRLVSANPQDKRVMIEEVAGITKFKLRKKESVKKMELTRQNIGRLLDLKDEVQKRLRELSGQAEKAEKAKTLKEKIERAELVVESHREFEYLQKYRELREGVQNLTQELEEAKLEKNRSELDLSAQRLAHAQLQAQLDEKQRLHNEKARELALGEERFRYLKESRQEKVKWVSAKEKENKDLEMEMAQQERREEEYRAELEKLEGDRPDEGDLEILQEKLSILREEVEYKEVTLREIRAELESGRQRLRQLEQQNLKNRTLHQEESLRLHEVQERLEWLEGEMSQKQQQQLLDQQQLSELKKREEQVVTALSSEQESLKRIEEERRTLLQEIKEITVKEAGLSSRLKILKEWTVVDQKEEGDLLAFLKTEKGASFRFVADLISGQSEDSFEGIQRLLGERLISLVSSPEIPASTLDSFKEWVLSGQKSHVSFLSPKSSPRLKNTELFSQLGLTPLSEHIRYPKEMGHLAALFENSFFTTAFSWELWEALKECEEVFYISDPSGSFLMKSDGHSRDLHFFGSKKGGQGLLHRQKERDELSQTLPLLREELEKKQALQNSCQKELYERREKREQLQRDLAHLSAQIEVKKRGLSQVAELLTKEHQRMAQLQAKREELSKSRLEALEKEEGLSEELQELLEEVAMKEELVGEREEEWHLKRSSYEEIRDEVLERETYIKTYEIRFKTLQNQVSDLSGRLEKQKVRCEENKKAISAYEKEIADTLILLEKLKEVNQVFSQDLLVEEKILKEMKQNFAQVQQQGQELDKKIRHATQIIHKNEREISVMSTKLEQIVGDEEQCVRNCFEKYQVFLRKDLALFLEMAEKDLEGFRPIDDLYQMEDEEGVKSVEIKSYNFVRRYGQDLVNVAQNAKRYQRELVQLGEINWMAVREYEVQKKRFDFLCEQEQQLNNSLKDLEEAVRHIDVKSKERFRDAFDAVQTQFGRIFPILFGGGLAKLQLVGEWEDPEAGVEIQVTPPGKKMQNINLLSGGEKALTAVSLIFATFLVRPSPFCLLDEVDAPLDDANVTRFNNLLRGMVRDSQFILITHNKKTMELNDVLYGVTMEEPGISKALSVRLQ